jgi:hypothetical protein
MTTVSNTALTLMLLCRSCCPGMGSCDAWEGLKPRKNKVMVLRGNFPQVIILPFKILIWGWGRNENKDILMALIEMVLAMNVWVNTRGLEMTGSYASVTELVAKTSFSVTAFNLFCVVFAIHLPDSSFSPPSSSLQYFKPHFLASS